MTGSSLSRVKVRHLQEGSRGWAWGIAVPIVKPILLATTPTFLERLGLPSLAALPSLAPLLGVDAEPDENPGEERTASEDVEHVESSEPVESSE